MSTPRIVLNLVFGSVLAVLAACNNTGGEIITPPIGTGISGTVSAPTGGNVQNTVVTACFVVGTTCDIAHANAKSIKITSTGPQASFTFSNLLAGKYGIYTDKDINNNGQSDAGDYNGCYSDATGCLGFTPPKTGINIQMGVVAGGGTGGGQCAQVWNADITVPTRMVNGPSACDYLLKGIVYVKSDLTIDPGVTIRADKDAIVWVEGGSISAVGTASNRIVMEGFSPLQGYWDGIRLSTFAGKIDLEYFDLKDAGQYCSSLYCPQGALTGHGGGQVTLKHSTFSNSYVHAVNLGEELVAFQDNKFYGNRWYGLLIGANSVDKLDAASDYYGNAKPNGYTSVGIPVGSKVSHPSTWKKLNAPYQFNGYFTVENRLTIAPGTTFVSNDGWISVDPGGTLIAVGTAAEPITFTGESKTPGAWDGIQFSVYNKSTGNQFDHVIIEYAGGNRHLALIDNYEAEISISNTVLRHSAGWAISCSENAKVLLQLGPGNVFSNNAYGDIQPVNDYSGCLQ